LTTTETPYSTAITTKARFRNRSPTPHLSTSAHGVGIDIMEDSTAIISVDLTVIGTGGSWQFTISGSRPLIS
jgi:hypothetical protein